MDYIFLGGKKYEIEEFELQDSQDGSIGVFVWYKNEPFDEES